MERTIVEGILRPNVHEDEIENDLQQTPVTKTVRLAVGMANLSRLNLAPFTMSVPLLGAIIAGAPPSKLEMLGLALIGLCAHCFGFALNDLIDLPYDRQAGSRQADALVTGRIRREEGWIFTLLQVPIALGIYALMGGRTLGIGVLCLSIGLSLIYNLCSKTGRLPRILPELALATSTSLLCMVGAWLRPGLPGPISIVFASELGLVLLLLNSVPSGLKDLKTDEACGIRSFVLSTGSRMLDEDRMQLSPLLRQYSAVLQATIWLCGFSLAVLIQPDWLISILVIGLSIFGALHLRMLLSMNSCSAMRRAMPLLNGFYNYTALAILISGSMTFWMQLAYVIFAAWLLSIPLRASLRVWRNCQVR